MQPDQEIYPQQFSKEIEINAAPEAIWAALTQPAQMQLWMAETPVHIDTAWQVGSPIRISGPWYKTTFENNGKVLGYEPHKKLSYTHLSSLSHLPDEEENYTVYEFILVAKDVSTTELIFSARRFATSVIYHHLAFYWNVTLHKIKQLAESGNWY